PLFQIRIANQIRSHECVAGIRQVTLIDDVKGYSGMKRNNGIHLPSVGQMAKHVVRWIEEFAIYERTLKIETPGQDVSKMETGQPSIRTGIISVLEFAPLDTIIS